MPSDYNPDNENTEIRAADESYPCLEVLSGPQGTGRFGLHEGSNVIGRSGKSDIILDDSSVSRRHAILQMSAQSATLRDEGSRNGTKVGGQKIQGTVKLSHQAKIKIGVYQLRFLIEPAPPETVSEIPEVDSAGELPDSEGPSEVEMEEASDAANLENLLKEGEIEPAPAKASSASFQKSKIKLKSVLYLLLGLSLVGSVVWSLPQIKQRFFKDSQNQKTTVQKGEEASLKGSAAKPPSDKKTSLDPIFLDMTSAPIPAQIYFGDQLIGTTPFKASTRLAPGKWYEIRALFSLPEVSENLEEKIQLSPPEGVSVMPVHVAAKIGVFKVAALPRQTELYLEGYFEKDPYRARPIKFAEIVFGKPIYVPFGRYVVELRKNQQISGSQTYLDQVVYRREFTLSAQQTSYTVSVEEGALKNFPVQVASTPPGAAVFIDEKEVGKTPYAGSFPVGEHILTLKKEGYFDYLQMIKMDLNMPYALEIQMKTSEAGELMNKATALIREERPTEALPLLVEAFSKNPTPAETAQISYLVGLCYLRQKNYNNARDYFTKAMSHEDTKFPSQLGIATLTYEQGDTLKALQLLVEVLASAEDPQVRSEAGILFHRLSPLKSVLYITSEPPGARVFVNTREMEQKTPLILYELGVGSYRIRFAREGYQETEIKLNLGVSEFRPVVVKMNRQ